MRAADNKSIKKNESQSTQSELDGQPEADGPSTSKQPAGTMDSQVQPGGETSGTNQPTFSLPNIIPSPAAINSKPIPKVASQAEQSTTVKIPDSKARPPQLGSIVSNSSLKSVVAAELANPPISTFPDPYSGLISSYTGAPTVPSTPIIREVLVGYVAPQIKIVVPEGWLPDLLEDPPQLVIPATIEHVNLSQTSRNAVNFDENILEYLVNPALSQYPRGLSLSTFQLNPNALNLGTAECTAGTVLGDSFVATYLLQDKRGSLQTNVTAIVSGAISAAAAMSVKYRGVLILDAMKIQHTSGIEAVPGMAWLQQAWYPPQYANPAMIKGLTGLHYVDASIRDIEHFKFGRREVIEYLNGGIAYRSRWATTYDNFTVELLGISQRYIDGHTTSFDELERLLLAHAPRGSVPTKLENDPRVYRPILRHDSDLLAGQLLYAIARQPSLKSIINELYSSYIQDSCLLREEPLQDFLSVVNSIPAAAPTTQAFNAKVGRASFPELIEALAFEIRPTFDYPSTLSPTLGDCNQILLCFLETTLFFIFFPKAAKYLAYELCNRYRLIFRKLYNLEWGQYTRQVGYAFQEPGSDSPIARDAYLSGVVTPTLLHGPAHNTNWQVTRLLSQLITPLGRMRERTRAQEAGLPIIDPSIFVAWDDPGENIYMDTTVANRIQEICSYTRQYIITAIKKKISQTNQQITALSAIVTAVDDRHQRLGNGLSRGIHRLFLGMIDFATNLVHGYDGSLETRVPAPIALWDGTHTRTVPAMVQDISGLYRISTDVVWTLIFATGFVFDTSQLLNDDGEAHEVFANFADAKSVLTKHMSMYAYAEKVCIAPSLIVMLLDRQNANREPYATLMNLLRIAGTTASILSAGAYKRLINLISKIFNASGVEKDGIAGFFNVTQSGDMRYMQPIFRRVSPLLTPIDPSPNDPTILQGNPQMLDSMYREMFEYGLNILLNPRSALSRLGQGFAIFLQTSEDVAFGDIFPDPGWPRVELASTNFITTRQGGFTVSKLRINDQDYGDARSLPNVILVMVDPGNFSPSELAFLIKGVTFGRIAILLPEVRYLYSIRTTDRHGFSEYVRGLDLANLINSAANTLVHLDLFNTIELERSDLRLTVGHCERYVFPLVAPNVTISFANMFGYHASPGYHGPDPRLYETGQLTPDWRNTLDNGVQKTLGGIYMANEIIVREKRAGMYELPNITCVMPDQLVPDDAFL